MERYQPATLNQGVPEAPGRSSRIDVASRRAALESLKSAIFQPPCAGPILITGESGAGKTRLWGRFADEAPVGWRFAVVQAGPTLDAVDFLGLAAAQLGVEPSNRLAVNRLAVASTLQDESADGRSWTLVVENAHQASPEVWTEIESLAAEAGRGPRREFAAILLVGRTELVRRLAGRPPRAFASRLAAHLHLPPLDVDEAGQLLASVAPGGLDADRVERLHRDAAGNPRALLRLVRAGETSGRAPSATARLSEPAPSSAPSRRLGSAAAPSPQPAAVASMSAAPLVPTRPPLREEEGLIEVGWSGSLEARDDPDSFDDESEEPAQPAVTSPPLGEEAIEDRYAALQAWTEWARNRDRLASTSEPTSIPAAEREPYLHQNGDRDEDRGDDLDPGLRTEREHEHAPFSQLFTRLGQSR